MTEADHDTTTDHRGVTRAGFLQLGAATVLGGGAVAATGIGPLAAPARAAGSTERIGPITGPGLTTAFRMEDTDLGIPVTCPDGRVLYIFGDTFEHAQGPIDPEDFWRSPTGLYTDGGDPADGITWTGAVGGGTAEQMLPYEHDADGIGTKIPSDAIEIDGVLYLYVWLSGTEGFGTLKGTEVWSSADNGATWQITGATWKPEAYEGILHNVTWARHDDGYVYLYSSKYRQGGLYLFRVPEGRLGEVDAYEPRGWTEAEGWQWGQDPTPVLEGKFGEMCLRPLDGKWLLTWFQPGNEEGETWPDDYAIKALVVDEPFSDLTAAEPTVLLRGGPWDQESDTVVAQLYGSYVVPGSTLEDLHLVVSQWNTTEGAEDDPYHAMHFRFTGVLG